MGSTKRIIPPHWKDRKSPPDVWNWQDVASWSETLWDLTSDILTDDVKNAFLENPPEFANGENLSWLEDTISKVHQRRLDIRSVVVSRLKEHYTSFRAAHGTRTDEIDEFYSKGLLPLDPKAAQARTAAFFLSGAYPELNEDQLNAAIRSIELRAREGRLFFDANEQHLIQYCGHYLLYGSEYIIAIAARLRGSRDYRPELQKIGRPYVLICDIPLALLRSYFIEEIVGDALAIAFDILRNKGCTELGKHEECGLCIHEPLPPQFIVGHYTPTIEYDPFNH